MKKIPYKRRDGKVFEKEGIEKNRVYTFHSEELKKTHFKRRNRKVFEKEETKKNEQQVKPHLLMITFNYVMNVWVMQC